MPLAPASPSARPARQRAIARNRSTLPDTADMLSNIRACYLDACTTGARAWYRDAHAYAQELADTYNLPLDHAAGIIAALSPATSWERNQTLARTLIETGDCAHAYGDAIRKAREILHGADPTATLGGRKVRSFFSNILHPTRSGAVTIDRHALSIALLDPTADVPDGARTRTRTLSDAQLKVLDRPGVYAYIAGCYRTVAREFGLLPHELQSITWDHWRTTYAFAAPASAYN